MLLKKKIKFFAKKRNICKRRFTIQIICIHLLHLHNNEYYNNFLKKRSLHIELSLSVLFT